MALTFHDETNPLVWSGQRMRMEVRLRLLRCALAFYRFLDVDRLAVRDIVLTGSNAAYNYTRQSDLDVHLIVDYASTPCPDLAENVFLAKKALWSTDYAVTIHGLPVELYVEDAAKPAKSNGVYSILHGRWLKTPSPVAPEADDGALAAKVHALSGQIDDLLASSPSENGIAKIMQRLRGMRQSGLLHGGEFSVENLAYKALRNMGYIDKLYDAHVKALADDLSL